MIVWQLDFTYARTLYLRSYMRLTRFMVIRDAQSFDARIEIQVLFYSLSNFSYNILFLKITYDFYYNLQK